MKDHHNIDDLEWLAHIMDSSIILPGTNIRIGLDPIIGLIPGIGDTITLAVSGYIVHRARQHGAPQALLAKMGWNIFIDWLVGIIPFFGDIFDTKFKANKKNVDLLKAHLKTKTFERDGASGKALFI